MKELIAFIITVECIITALFNLHFGEKYYPDDKDKILLNSALIADIHTDGDALRDRNNIIRSGIAGISRSAVPVDALVMAGDITNSAAKVEYTNLNRFMATYNKAVHIIPEMGNHDSRGTSIYPDFEEASEFFRDFCTVQGIETDKNYYSTIVNGYYFIVMGTEALLQNNAYISDEQLRWLDETITLAEKSGKPVFIINHQPLSGTGDMDTSSKNSGCVGEASDEIRSILLRHAQGGTVLLYVSGHLHSDLCDGTFDSEGSVYYLNLPAFLYSYGGGCGFAMEVYENRILLRARNYITGEWMTDGTYEISL